MSFLDIFVGVPQSKYAGAAILMSLIAVSLAILVGRDSLPLSQKFAFVLLIFLVSLPGLLLTLFQLTCMVTGDKKGGAWWCGWYSWLVSGLLVVYSVLLVSVAVMTLASGGKVLDQIAKADAEKFSDATAAANAMAAEYFHQDQPHTGSVDGQASLPAPVTEKQKVPGGIVSLDPLMVDAIPSVNGNGMNTLTNVAPYEHAAENFASFENFQDATASPASAPAAPPAVAPAAAPAKKPVAAPAAPAAPTGDHM
jgi:hypothetical protein